MKSLKCVYKHRVLCKYKFSKLKKSFRLLQMFQTSRVCDGMIVPSSRGTRHVHKHCLHSVVELKGGWSTTPFFFLCIKRTS